MSDEAPAAVVVLAAGEGTRMRSTTPKVLHELLGRSLLQHVLAAVTGLRPGRVAVVVGHSREAVGEQVAAWEPPATVVVQESQDGTGHAVRVALEALPDVTGGTVVVVNGDTPLLTTQTLQALLTEHARSSAHATVLTARLADPTGYGRILRASDGSVAGIVEERDATPDQRGVDEVNSGMYAFDVVALRAALGRLQRDNSQGEEYLTDVVGLLRADGQVVAACPAPTSDEVLGVNDQVQLAAARALLRDRILVEWMRLGVVVHDPATTWVDVGVELAAGAELLPGTRLQGSSTVATGAVLGPDVTLVDTSVGEGARVRSSTAEQAVIGARADVGPHTWLRTGAVLGVGARAGAAVEIKNSVLGDGAKVKHLSYIGDADIGEGANIGAATIVANYDGQKKHRTVVGANVSTGSDTVLVAPVVLGDGAYTAAGSVVTEDVPSGAIAVARGRQRNIAGWVERRRAGSPAARAAAAARARQTPGGAGATPPQSTPTPDSADNPDSTDTAATTSQPDRTEEGGQHP